MGHTSGPVPKLFIEQSDLKPQIMKEKEKDAPFKKWNIESFESFDTERPRVVKIFSAEEISCRDKEQRHMEDIDKIGDKGRGLSMAHHHQDDGNPLTY